MIFFTYQSGPRRSELRTVVLTHRRLDNRHLTDTKQTVEQARLPRDNDLGGSGTGAVPR
jgi:hypothetical protein